MRTRETSIDQIDGAADGIVKANKYRPFSTPKLAERGGNS